MRIVPVSKLLVCSCCGTPATVSDFVEGHNLEEIPPKFRRNLPFDVKELTSALSLFSLFLQKNLGYDGIFIVPRNVKLGNGVLFVTDLCPRILSLVRRTSS